MGKTGLLSLLALRLTCAATIQGTVVEHSSGHPLARALVQITAVGVHGAGGAFSVRCNSSGQFVFSGLGAGAYLLSASRSGFAVLRYGQKRWTGAATPIFLPEPESSFVAELRLKRLGAIAGTILDENRVGIPEQNVVVYQPGSPLRLVSKAKTDDRGAYRVGGLEPGQYYVRVSGGQYEEEGSGLLPTFFKASAAVEGAQIVEVDLDQQADDVDIQPALGKVYRLAGEALGPPGAVRTNLELHSDMGTVSGPADASGHFLFNQLAPGVYELTAEATSRTGEKLGAYQKITVDKDMEGFQLPMTVQPLVFFEFEEPHEGQRERTRGTVWARRKGVEGVGPARRIRPEEEQLLPGPWEISVTPPQGTYVVSITNADSGAPPAQAAAGWKEVFLGGRYLRIKVKLSASPAELSGRVTSGDQPAAGAPVFLEPVELESGVGLMSMRKTTADLQGRYRFTGLAPGRYQLLSSFDFERPTREEMQAAPAKTVSLKEETKTRQDLDLFSAQ